MKFLILPTLMILLFFSRGESQSQPIEQFAQFPGGVEKFYDYLSTNLQYPADAITNNISGDVHIEFIVDTEGNVVLESVRAITSLSPSCDEEAVRLVKNSPQWIPAQSQGANIVQYITIPVSFRLR